MKLSKNWLPGSDSNARTRIQSPESCTLDDPASSFQRYRFHTPHAQHSGFINVVPQPFAINASTIYKSAMIAAALAVKL